MCPMAEHKNRFQWQFVNASHTMRSSTAVPELLAMKIVFCLNHKSNKDLIINLCFAICNCIVFLEL